MTTDQDWPFDQAPNVVAFTLKRIIERNSPILLVIHDRADDGWQFLDGKPMTMADAMLVGMKEIVRRDATVCEVASLPSGYVAERTAIGKEWTISEQEPVADEEK